MKGVDVGSGGVAGRQCAGGEAPTILEAISGHINHPFGILNFESCSKYETNQFGKSHVGLHLLRKPLTSLR